MEIKTGWYRNDSTNHPIVYLHGPKKSSAEWILEFSGGGLFSTAVSSDGVFSRKELGGHRLIEHLPDCTGFDWKSEKYVPFTRETCPVGAVVTGKLTGDKYLITLAAKDSLCLAASYECYEGLLAGYTIDGKPAGKVQS